MEAPQDAQFEVVIHMELGTYESMTAIAAECNIEPEVFFRRAINLHHHMLQDCLAGKRIYSGRHEIPDTEWLLLPERPDEATPTLLHRLKALFFRKPD
jgi:hypothetical protein